MLLLVILHIYFVSFLDKPEKSVPQLSPRAVEQRERWNIPTDEKDYPVSPLYLDELQKAGAYVHHVSRWFNGATVEMDEETAEKVRAMKFVTDVEMTREAVSSQPSALSRQKSALSRQPSEARTQLQAYSDKQLALYNLPPLHEAGFEGQGILMVVCDGGFYNAQTLSCFRQKELELGHFDFTDDTDDFYGTTGAHGTECLSTVSALTAEYKGAATKAPYYLMRAEENATESPKEMDNLVAALEKADSLGANIFSVSLGYAMFDNEEWTLHKDELDGRSTRSSLAATIAARKGMLVCVAAGNEGNGAWKTLSSPADADSVLAVGAVDTLGQIGSFSSYGPSADGRVKPEVCAVGVKSVLVNPGGTIVASNGTSFATPLIAGMAACIWSALPEENAMQIRERIIRSADRYGNPDKEQYGYGIPDAWKAYSMTLPTEIEEVENQNSKVENSKVLRNGQLYIIRGKRVFDILGRECDNR